MRGVKMCCQDKARALLAEIDDPEVLMPYELIDLPDRSVGIEPRRKVIPGRIHMVEGRLLEYFDHHLFPGCGHVEWRPTDKHGPPERINLLFKQVEEVDSDEGN